LASNIRVYELARELGLTNKETLDLCSALGIGVKSHSSSIVDAQADRVRRKAEREGLIRDSQPEEPAEKKGGKKAAAAAAAPKAQAAPARTEAPKPAAEAPAKPAAPAAAAAADKPAAEKPAADKAATKGSEVRPRLARLAVSS